MSKRKNKNEEHKLDRRINHKVKICFWNVAGLQNKDIDFWNYVGTMDVLAMTETWIDEKSGEKFYSKLPKEFKWEWEAAIKEKKKGRAKGGILIGVRKSLEEIVNEDESGQSVLQRKILINDEIWRIVVGYRSENDKDMWGKIEKITEEKGDDARIIVGGDFNARTGENGSIEEEIEIGGKRKSKDKTINNEGKKLIQMTERAGLYLLNGNHEGDEEGEYTYIGGNGRTVIDYVMCNAQAREEVESLSVEERTESDHLPLVVRINSNREIDRATKTDRIEFEVWDEKGVEHYQKNLSDVKLESEGIDEELSELTNKIAPAILRRWSTNRNQKTRQKWWTEECWIKKKEVSKLLKLWKKNIVGIEEYRNKRREFKKLCQLKKKEQEKKDEDEIMKIKQGKELWKFIRRERKKRPEISENIQLEEWKNYFMQLLEGTENQPSRVTRKRNEVGKIELSEIKEEDVENEIRNLKKNKSPGSNNLKNEVWIYANKKVKEKITNLVNRIWHGEGFPEEWRMGIITPIYKKGNRELLNNYRGITLLDTLYKIYAGILNRRLKEEIEEKSLLPETQAGFRKGRGTVDNVYVLNQIIEQELNKEKGKVFVMFADLKAAFDSVNRSILWEKMKQLNISENLMNRIQEIYTVTKNKVKIKNEFSNVFYTVQGLRQGCPISPTLFTVYIALIENVFKKAQSGGAVVGRQKLWTLSYADDLALIAKEEGEMKCMLKTLEKFLQKIKLELNVEKSKMVVFRNKRGRKEYKWKWQEKEIEEVKTFPYLGYHFQCNNKPDEHIKSITAKARRAIGQIWSIGERRFGGDVERKLMLFDAIVKSVLMYGSEIWGWREAVKIEQIQNTYLRWILGLTRSTPQYILLEETKRQKLRIEAGKRAIKYEEKIRDGKNLLLTQCFLETTRRRVNSLETKWDKERRKYFERNGMSLTKVEEERRKNTFNIKKIIDRDLEVQKQLNMAKMERSQFCNRYQHIWTIDKPQYLSLFKNQKEKIKMIARFRCGCEEMGSRYWKEEKERSCRICNEAVESVEHWAEECSKLERSQASVAMLLSETGEGWTWMKEVMRKIKEN